MRKKVLKWEVTGAIFTMVFGILLHYLYKLSGYLKSAAFISAVNESIWEHTKISFWPAFIFAVIEFFFIRKHAKNFITAKAASLLVIPILTIGLFYAYTIILGHDLLFIDISIYFITIIVSFIISYKISVMDKLKPIVFNCSVIVLAILVIAFSVFTFYPPHLGIFSDPHNGKFGF